MTDRARWVYALPLETATQVTVILGAEGFELTQKDPDAPVSRYEDSAKSAAFVAFASPELEVLLVEASGEAAAVALGRILDQAGFFAQSQLLGAAVDVRDPEAPKALRTLAHMVVAWDEDWSDLFLLHLASPDPVVRHDAVAALCVAALVAREVGPAVHLLEEARKREKFPKLNETMGEAIRMIQAATGAPVEATPEP